MKLDYFEIERVIEELAKNYAAPCTTTWFKVTSNRRPSAEEYREKVVDFMRQFEAVLSGQLPPSEQTEDNLPSLSLVNIEGNKMEVK